MAINVTVSPPIGNLLASLDAFPAIKRASMEAGGQYVHAFLLDYYGKMDWRGPRWIPGPNSGEFAKRVVEGWQPPEMVSDSEVVIRNTFGLLAWKITGGVISPRIANWLTIPLVPRAKGISARAFGQRLFRVGDALMRRIGQNIEAVYALSKSVTQKPWPGALPPEDAVTLEFLKGVELVLK